MMGCTVSDAIRFGREKISVLDAEILLAGILKSNRAHLHAFPEKILTENEIAEYEHLCSARQNGWPVAYLLHSQSFWTLDLEVTPDTLIPRPETELLVETALQHVAHDGSLIADLGTGSGAIALALASERPNLRIHATDISREALHVARKNATRLGLSIVFHKGDWLQALPEMLFDVIVSNPPYIAAGDSHLAALQHEPQLALVSGSDGLSAIRKIVSGSGKYLQQDGWLFIEHGFDQAKEVRNLFEKAGFIGIFTKRDLSGQERVTGGKWHER